MKNVSYTTNLCGVNIKVTAEYVGAEVNTLWNYLMRPKYKACIENTDSKENFTTNYWGSVHNLNEGNTEVTEDLLQDMLRSVFEDACAGDMPFDDFCNEFGYDDIKKAKKIYDLCVESKNNLKGIFDEKADLNEIFIAFVHNESR